LRSPLGWVAEALALVRARAGAMEDAARLAGFARHVHPAASGRVGARRAVLFQLQTVLRAALPAVRRTRLAAEGAAWTDADAIVEAGRVCAAAA